MNAWLENMNFSSIDVVLSRKSGWSKSRIPLSERSELGIRCFGHFFGVRTPRCNEAVNIFQPCITRYI